MRLLIAALLSTCLAVSASAAGWPGMNQQIDQTNFLVNDNCSATLIDAKQGYLITANHCIRDQFTVVEREKIDDNGKVTTEKVRVAKPGTVSQLYFKDSDEVQRNSYVFKIKSNDADLDLALIQVQTKLANKDNAKIACADVQRGDDAFAVGNPRGVLYASVSQGIIASTDRNYRMLGSDDSNADNGLTQSTTPVGGGSSGGALYNSAGEFIGVVVRGYQTVAPIALSVPLRDVKKFLDTAGLKALWASCEKAK